MVPVFLALALAQATVPPTVTPPDPMGRETEATAVAAAIHLHHRMDRNGDGYVTPVEMADWVRTSMNGLPIPGTDADHPLPPLSARLFAAADTDHDRRISLAEAVARAHADFAAQDANRDGYVTPEERMAFLNRVIGDGHTPEGVALAPAR